MKKKTIQFHHLIYGTDKQPEVIEKVYMGEHWILAQLKRYKFISKGFIKSLKFWILLNEDKAEDL